jgi:3-methyladenine DNA glycosylase/8-oxoguanine DNA glycosylase
MRRCAEAVAAGRLDLQDHDLRRLASMREIGPWTCEMVALHGQGRYDLVPAGDLGFIKIVGRLLTGNPKARADEAEVRAFFEPYGEWKGLAGVHLMHAAARGLIRAPMSRGRAPRPAGTRWSTAPARRLAA